MTCEEMIYSNDFADFMINYLNQYEGGSNYYKDGCVSPIIDKIAIFHSPRGNDFLNNLETVPYSFIPKLYGLMDETVSFNVESYVNQIRDETDSLTGKGTMIGIIDTGINFFDKIFYDEENGMKSSKIDVIWDQTILEKENRLDKSDENNLAGNSKDVRFFDSFAPFGSVYEKKEIEQALSIGENQTIVPHKDKNGHGTFLAGIAAGNVDYKNNFSGIARGASLGIVKLKEAKPYLKQYFGVSDNQLAYQETDIIYAVRFLVEYAKSKNMPISILIGVGSSNGGHYGQTFLERYLDTILENVGVMVSVPAGNEGNQNLHYHGLMEVGEDYQQVELNVGENQTDLTLELWGKSPGTFSLGIISPQGDQIEKVAPRFGQEETFVLPKSGTKIYVAYQLVETYTGNELIFVRINGPTEGLWRLMVYGEMERKREYDIWLPLRQFLDSDTNFLKPDPYNTVTNPGNANLVMCMSAFNQTNNAIYAAAGRGYNSDNQVVPSLVAPGVDVLGPGLTDNYVTMTGTSVAAAYSAGIMALFLQWNMEHMEIGYFYANQIKNLFLKQAIRLFDVNYPNSIDGYGQMNLERVLDELSVIEVS